MPMCEEIKPDTKINITGSWSGRSVSSRSLGWHVEGVTPLQPDYQDVETIVNGARHRFAREPPSIDAKLMRRFRSFVRVWVRKHCVPLQSVPTVEEWLENSNYPLWRCNQILKAWDEADRMVKKKHFKLKSFIKREYYPVHKNARWINSRSDAFKAFSGPAFAAMEEQLFKNKHFVKFIPVEDRSSYIDQELAGDGPWIATDHTAFEAHITPEVMNACEFQYYDWMLKYIPGGKDQARKIRRALGGIQACHMRNVNVSTYARMSGDMCTSLGNGFTNLMVMKFMASEHEWKGFAGVVEGDDGLFKVTGARPSDEFFRRLGFDMKLEYHEQLNEAGFCSIFYAPGELENLVDPIKMLARSGWTHARQMNGGEKVMLGLSKAKALSMICECPANPITSKLSLWILRNSRGIKACSIEGEPNQWWLKRILMSNLDKCIARAKQGPSPAQRLFTEQKWGITVQDQKSIETYIEGLTKIQPLRHDAIYRLCSELIPTWCDNWVNTFEC